VTSPESDPLDRADAFLRQGNIPLAKVWARRALAMDPQEPAVNNLLGVLSDAEYDLVTAATAFGRALAPDPYNTLVFGNLAGTLARFGMVEPAVRIARRTIALAPSDVTAHNNMAQALKGAGYLHTGLSAYRRAVAIRPDSALHSNLLFAMSYSEEVSSDALFAEYRRWERLYAARYYPGAQSRANTIDPERRLIVGYLSQDLREHPLGRIQAALFEHHDPAIVQINAYASIRRSDDLTERCRRQSTVWQVVTGLSDDEVAARIRQDKVDILVVVGGHTAHNRLLVAARRPAPIQVALDDVSTSGMSAMDYWISDPLLHPADGTGATERFTEEVLRLPCFFLQPVYEDAPPVSELPVLKLGQLTFGSFSNPAKLTAPTIAAWAQALRAVPASRLALKYVDWYADRAVQERVSALFAAHGIGADRIVFAGGDHERNDQLALWNNVDIALDPYPFGGWTSSFESLWMGVPVITLLGERFAGRVGLAVLERLGLGDLVARRPEEFAGIAAALASDRARLATLRSGLRERLRQSPLCDGQVQAGYFETAYREVWRRWCASQTAIQASR